MTTGALPDDHKVATYQHLALALGGTYGGDGDAPSFTGDLLRLIAKADPQNRARLRIAFPVQVAAWEIWNIGAGTMTAAELLDLANDVARAGVAANPEFYNRDLTLRPDPAPETEDEAVEPS
jgi:hypothetical protein